MIARNPNLLCKQAEPYYYDFLCDDSRGLIPESVVNHIEQCQNCREQINKLKAALSQADAIESEQGQVRSAVTAMLKLHFDYVGKPVTCNVVKPFLPCLLDPALEIRIPTPIITHLHNCQQCSEDLDMIRCLNLNRKQLCRLSQLFADERGKSNVSCWQAHDAVVGVLSMVFRETNQEVLKHICTCPHCRKLLYEYREAARREFLREKREQKFPCEEVSASDIFDYVVPYGIDPANDQYAKFRKSLTSHVITCPTCLAKMQQLHKTIYNIAERAESDVVTVYYIDESAKTEARSESDDIYTGFPVRVEAANREDKVNTGPSASAIAFGAVLKQKVSAMKLKSLAKAAVAAAAVILIAVALFLSTQTAKAVSIDQIYEALERIRNVYLAAFDVEKTKPTQEMWVSQALNIMILKSETQCVLWDIKNKSEKSRDLDTDSITMTELDNDALVKIEKTMKAPWGLLPFDNISKIPPGAKWQQVPDKNIGNIVPDTEVYDLIWIPEKKLSDSAARRKWRGYVDSKTRLPKRVEWWLKLAEEEEYKLVTITTVSYPTVAEVQAAVRDVGF